MRIVYRGPNRYTIVKTFRGVEWPFERDMPVEIPDELAKSLLSNNPAPWQNNDASVFEAVGAPEGRSA